MAYRQVEDILKTIEGFHEELAKEINRYSDCSSDSRLELLSDYEKHQRNAICAAVEQDEEQYPEVDVREAWIQFVPDDEVKRALEKLQLKNDEPIAALFTHVLETDQALVEMYDAIIAQTNSAHVKEFFESLRKASVSFAEQRSWGMRQPSN
ncbi:MAG: hypothetical protein HUJ26_22180 [Planctomycetaceae bacterium]|nr:hypothetical protein [Planctomycetaceae bacterium]